MDVPSIDNFSELIETISQKYQRLKSLDRLSLKLKKRRKLYNILKIIIIGRYLQPKIDLKLIKCESEFQEIIFKINDDISACWDYLDGMCFVLTNCNKYLTIEELDVYYGMISKLADFPELVLNNNQVSLSEIDNRLMGLFYSGSLLSFEFGDYNRVFIEKEKVNHKYLFVKDKLEFDPDQKEAVIVDENVNLVIAGAGSGKTEVITTKIAYLTSRSENRIDERRILALAYGKDAQLGMQRRLKDGYALDINVRTFHSIGYEIVKKTVLDDWRPDIIDNGDKRNLVSSIHNQLLIEDRDYERKVISYLRSYGENSLSEMSCEKSSNNDEKKTYNALDGTEVKSIQEMEICNFYLCNKMNGYRLKLEYESPAKWAQIQTERGFQTFNPDFFLPDLDIYHEHWALDRQGNAPEHFNDPHYAERALRKKAAFSVQTKYRLIETYSYEFEDDSWEDRIIDQINKIMIDRNINMPIWEKCSVNEIVDRSTDDIKQSFYNVPEDIILFIDYVKENGMSVDDIKKAYCSPSISERQRKFCDISLLVYQSYQKRLTEMKKFEFSDLINLAIKKLGEENNSLFRSEFDYILVDEFQDISHQRLRLITALLRINPGCKLFCVGDDWQAIYGFTGMDVDIFVNFEKYINRPVKKMYLKHNYRSRQNIVRASNQLISNNGASQISKHVFSIKEDRKKITLIKSKATNGNYDSRVAERTSLLASDIVSQGKNPGDIMILTRINKTADQIIERLREMRLPCEKGLSSEKISILTAHKSKGSQASIVIIAGVDDHPIGFPCRDKSSYLILPLKINKNQSFLEEERRLFYVAMTRAKDELYIVTAGNKPSPFISEISKECAIKII